MRPNPVTVRPDEVVIQIDEGLLNPLLRDPHEPPHQDHKREEDLCHNTSQLLGEKDIPSPKDCEDEKEATGKHEEDEDPEDQSENEGKGRMDVLQPDHGDIPKQEDEKG